MSDMRVYSTGMTIPQQNYTSEVQKAAAADKKKETQPVQTPAAQEDDVKSLHEMIREAREKAEARRESLQLPKNSTQYSNASVEAYARLARARNHAEVNSASGYARRRIAQFKAALRQDSENADRIRAAISQLQKAVSRAGKKKRDLDHEKLTEIRRKKSVQENQRREELRLRQELNRRKTMRVIRESGYIREAVVDSRLQEQLSATQMELRAQAQALSSMTSATINTAAQQYTAQMSGTAGGEGSAEINIQA